MQVNIEKRYAYAILGLLIILAGILIIQADIPLTKPDPGHTINEVQGVSPNCYEILLNQGNYDPNLVLQCEQMQAHIQNYDPSLWDQLNAGTVSLAAWAGTASYLHQPFSCPSGQALQRVGPNLEKVCVSVGGGGGGAVDSVTGSSGINANPTTGDVVLTADTNYLQRRVTDDCITEGAAIQAIASDGSVTCSTFGSTDVTCTSNEGAGESCSASCGLGFNLADKQVYYAYNLGGPFQLDNNGLGGVWCTKNEYSEYGIMVVEVTVGDPAIFEPDVCRVVLTCQGG